MSRRPSQLDELIDRYRAEARESGTPYYGGLVEGLRIARRVLFPADPDAAVLERLHAYRDARADIHAAVREATTLGWGPTRIAREAGLTRPGLAKMLNRADEQ